MKKMRTIKKGDDTGGLNRDEVREVVTRVRKMREMRERLGRSGSAPPPDSESEQSTPDDAVDSSPHGNTR